MRRDGHDTRGIADETIFATVYEKPEYLPPSGPFGHTWDPNVHFVASHDFFNSQHDKVVACGNMFEIISHKVFLALPSKCPTAPDGQAKSVPQVWCVCVCVSWCVVCHGVCVLWGISVWGGCNGWVVHNTITSNCKKSENSENNTNNNENTHVTITIPSAHIKNHPHHHQQQQQGVSNEQVTLYVSDDHGASFQEVCLPTPLEDRGYNLVRTHDAESVFLIIDHDEQDSWEVRVGVCGEGRVYGRGSRYKFVFLCVLMCFYMFFVCFCVIAELCMSMCAWQSFTTHPPSSSPIIIIITTTHHHHHQSLHYHHHTGIASHWQRICSRRKHICSVFNVTQTQLSQGSCGGLCASRGDAGTFWGGVGFVER